MNKKLEKDNSDELIGGEQKGNLCLDADPTSEAVLPARATAEMWILKENTTSSRCWSNINSVFTY